MHQLLHVSSGDDLRIAEFVDHPRHVHPRFCDTLLLVSAAAFHPDQDNKFFFVKILSH